MSENGNGKGTSHVLGPDGRPAVGVEVTKYTMAGVEIGFEGTPLQLHAMFTHNLHLGRFEPPTAMALVWASACTETTAMRAEIEALKAKVAKLEKHHAD